MMFRSCLRAVFTAGKISPDISCITILMKILQINNVHYRRGGADAVYLNTAELLLQNGQEVIFFNTLKKDNIPCKDERYWVSSIESRAKGLKSTLLELRNFFYNPEAAKKIEILIKAEKPDIAHIHLFWGCGISPSITKVLKKYNIPLVQTVHDYRMICPIALLMDREGHVCERCQGRFFYKAGIYHCSHHGRIRSIIMAAETYYHNRFFYPTDVVNGFIFVSHFALNKHIQYMPKMKGANTTVLYNFAPVDDVLSRDDTVAYFLFYGRLSHEKGIKTLIEVFKNNVHLKLKIVGTGPLEKDLRSQYNNYYNIEFLGYRSGESLKSLVRNAMFVCVPSEWYENNPMTIVEAYSMGTPVIGARIGGIPEIVEDGTTGYQFESGNVGNLSQVINYAASMNTDDYTVMRQNARMFYQEHFSPNNYYERLMDFYKHTIELYE